MSGNTNALLPANPKLLSHDSIPAGSGAGLGCSSNGVNAVCTYQGSNGGNLVYYDAAGNRLWSSSLLTTNINGGVPLISTAGEVIAADAQNIIRFAADGSVIWQTTTPSSNPISLILINGLVIRAPLSGPISAYRVEDGALVGTLLITDPVIGNFITVNTPCAVGNRIYIAFQSTSLNPSGRLSAVDIDPKNSAGPLQEAWHYNYSGSTGGSPLAIGSVIYFDSGSLSVGKTSRAYMYAVQDLGTSGQLLWQQPIEAGIQAAPTQDPRGGLWIWPIYRNYLQRLDQSTGVELQRIYIDQLVGASGYVPYSAMTIATTSSGNPAMLVGAATALTLRPGYLCAIDLKAGTLVWKWPLPPVGDRQNFTASQVPVLTLGSTVVCPTWFAGAYFLK